MQAIVIDVYDAEAYVALEDGTNACIGLAHMPANVKVGSKVNISVNTMTMTNHKIPGGFL